MSEACESSEGLVVLYDLGDEAGFRKNLATYQSEALVAPLATESKVEQPVGSSSSALGLLGVAAEGMADVLPSLSTAPTDMRSLLTSQSVLTFSAATDWDVIEKKKKMRKTDATDAPT